MTKCKECVWWGAKIPWHGVLTRGNLKVCACRKIHRHASLYWDKHGIAEDEAVVEFDESWGIMTGPEFGCVHGEERREGID